MAPLEHTDFALDQTTWYAAGTLAPLRDEPIDALIVDGPPGGPDRPLSRYPALPFFMDALGPNALVVLDDVARPGEREILDRWESEFEPAFERRPDLRIAMAVSCRRPGPFPANRLITSTRGSRRGPVPGSPAVAGPFALAT